MFQPNSQEIAGMLADTDALAERRRLLSISWWMRSLCEPIARRANLEDQALVSGDRFQPSGLQLTASPAPQAMRR